MTYAKDTTIPIDKTKTDIEKLLVKHGATGFAYAWTDDRSMIGFQIAGRRIQMELPLPDRNSREITHSKINSSNWRRKIPESQQQARYDQACRARWRALLLIVKAKLEAVEAGISTIESEFLAHVALPSGVTVGAWAHPQIEDSYRTGKMPPLLPG